MRHTRQGTPTPPPDDQSFQNLTVVTMILVAISKLSAKWQAFFIQLLHPELKDGQIAQLCGLSQSTLSRSDSYRQARQRTRRSANVRAKGEVAGRRVTRNSGRPHAPRQATALTMIESGLRQLKPVELAVWLAYFQPEMKKGRIADLCGISPSRLSESDAFRRLQAAVRRASSIRRGWIDRDGNIEAYESHPE